MIHWESLCPGGLRFAWDDGRFRPGTDTFLLSSLPRLRPGLRVCELGCGSGLLSLLLLQRQRELAVTGLEIREDAAALARQAVTENQLEDRLTILQGDLRQVRGLLSAGSFDLAVCNPPYYPVGSGRPPSSSAEETARTEESCTLEDVCAAAAWLLPWGGTLCLVHKPERLTDLLVSLRQAGLESKRLRFVAKAAGASPSLVLAEARRGGRPGLSVEAPLILRDSSGGPSAELEAIYFRTEAQS